MSSTPGLGISACLGQGQKKKKKKKRKRKRKRKFSKNSEKGVLRIMGKPYSMLIIGGTTLRKGHLKNECQPGEQLWEKNFRQRI